MSRLIKAAWNKAFMSLCFLFPILNCKHANNILSKKIKSLENREMNFEYMSGWDALTVDEVQEFYSTSLEHKKSLESKAQLSIVGLTIAVSLMIGIGGSLLGNSERGRSDIDRRYLEPLFGQIDRVHPGAAAQLQHPTGLEVLLFKHTLQI